MSNLNWISFSGSFDLTAITYKSLIHVFTVLERNFTFFAQMHLTEKLTTWQTGLQKLWGFFVKYNERELLVFVWNQRWWWKQRWMLATTRYSGSGQKCGILSHFYSFRQLTPNGLIQFGYNSLACIIARNWIIYADYHLCGNLQALREWKPSFK